MKGEGKHFIDLEQYGTTAASHSFPNNREWEKATWGLLKPFTHTLEIKPPPSSLFQHIHFLPSQLNRKRKRGKPERASISPPVCSVFAGVPEMQTMKLACRRKSTSQTISILRFSCQVHPSVKKHSKDQYCSLNNPRKSPFGLAASIPQMC